MKIAALTHAYTPKNTVKYVSSNYYVYIQMRGQLEGTRQEMGEGK